MKAQSGIETEGCNGGGLDVTSIDDGDWISVRGVDFGAAGAKSFSARVASTVSGGAIEVRNGSPTGPLLATCRVPSTGGAQIWATTTCAVTGATGIVKDLYFRFTGPGFAFDFWQFTGGDGGTGGAGGSPGTGGGGAGGAPGSGGGATGGTSAGGRDGTGGAATGGITPTGGTGRGPAGGGVVLDAGSPAGGLGGSVHATGGTRGAGPAPETSGGCATMNAADTATPTVVGMGGLMLLLVARRGRRRDRSRS